MDISPISAGVPIRAGGWPAPLWQHLHRRRRPAPVATAAAAALASRKNATMVPPGGGRGPARRRDLRRRGRPACAVQQAAVAPPSQGRRQGGGQRAPETGRREAETALHAGRSCADALMAWGGRAADGELRPPGVTREESGSRAAAAGGSAALWRTASMFFPFFIGVMERCESREWASSGPDVRE
jgi:hypothetical protein